MSEYIASSDVIAVSYDNTNVIMENLNFVILYKLINTRVKRVTLSQSDKSMVNLVFQSLIRSVRTEKWETRILTDVYL